MKKSLVICFFVLLSAFITIETFATNYYITPNGGSDSNNGTSTSTPWATFSHAMGTLSAGDTLYLMDGTFTESLNVTVSGTSGNPITFGALNDGKVTVDGTGNKSALLMLAGTSYIDVNGIIFRNGNRHVVSLHKSNNINLKRVSAYNASSSGNYHVYSIGGCSYVLCEDCVASGSGRTMWTVNNSDNCTLRRCYGRWTTHTGSGGSNGIVQIYGTDDSVVENVVGTYANNPVAESGKTGDGIGIWNAAWSNTSNNNKIYGCIQYGGYCTWTFYCTSAKHPITGNRFKDCVSVGSTYNFLVQADDDMVAENLTLIGDDQVLFSVGTHPKDPKDGDFIINTTLKNSVLDTSARSIVVGNSALDDTYVETVTNTYNDLYNCTTDYCKNASQGTGEIDQDPAWNVTTYGSGTYLIRPDALEGLGENGADMGAEVLYRYEDGVLTSTPLWPWPMEDRIFAETGVSVTWEAYGGLWKTLDGVYSAGDTISPPKLKLSIP